MSEEKQNIENNSDAQLDEILDSIIKESGLYQEGSDEEMKRVYKDKLRALLEERVGLALMHELQNKDPKLLIEFQEIAQKGDEKNIEKFLSENIENRNELAAQVIRTFASEYIQDSKNLEK